MKRGTWNENVNADDNLLNSTETNLFRQHEFILELKHDVACYARDGTTQTKNGVIVCDRVDNIAAELRVRARRACG